MTNLIELAVRVEAATAEQQRELLEDAFRLAFPKPERVWVTDNTGDWTDEYSAHHSRSWHFSEMIEAEAFLDSAMTLVPEGCDFGAGRADGKGHAVVIPKGKVYENEIEAATPALALCAAALRAREGEG